MPQEPFHGKGRTDGVRVRVNRDKDMIFRGKVGIKFIVAVLPGLPLDRMNLPG